MMKLIIIILASFSLLSAEDTAAAAPNIQSKMYSIEGQYEGKDGTFYYKAQQVEIIAMEAGRIDRQQSNNTPKPLQERHDLVNNESTFNKDRRLDKRPYEERKDFVSSDSSKELNLDKRPYEERKDFVNNELPTNLFLTGVGKPNQTIDWIYGNKNIDISFGFVSNELYMYKTTTYLMVVKPKMITDSNSSTTKTLEV